MKIRREFKIGVFAVIVILVSWWGITWLGAQDLFKSYNTYYVYYDEVSKDLKVSSRVYIRGVDVGSVRDISLEGDKVKVEIAVDNNYAEMIPDNSVALITEGLMGGAQVILEQGDSKTLAKNGSTLDGRLDEGLMDMLADKGTELIDNLNTTMGKLDETVEGVNAILNDNRENIGSIVANLETMSTELTALVSETRGDIDNVMGDVTTFTAMLKENSANIESLLENLSTFSGDLADSTIIEDLTATVENINGIISTIENGEGSVGKLLKDESVHQSLNDTIDSVNALVTDLKEHPMRYVHFSLFGKSEEEIAAKEAKKAAKAAKRAEKAAANSAE
ncbi:MAG: MCE family protein [Rikenellaceae bacterium]|nr:MCE family protein [Rikenellaceae bacterium]